MNRLGTKQSDIDYILTEKDFDIINKNNNKLVLFTNYLLDDMLSMNKRKILVDTYTGMQVECNLLAVYKLYNNKDAEWDKMDMALLADIKNDRIKFKRDLYDEWLRYTGTNHLDLEGHMNEPDFILYKANEKNTRKYAFIIEIDAIVL